MGNTRPRRYKKELGWNRERTWAEIEKELGLKLPKLAKRDLNRNLGTHVNLLGFRTFKRTKPVTEGTIE